MKVVILAGTTAEATGYIEGAGLSVQDVVAPRSANAVHGLQLDEGDLIVQFPSWRDVPEGRRAEIRAALRAGFIGVGPVWQAVGQ